MIYGIDYSLTKTGLVSLQNGKVADSCLLKVKSKGLERNDEISNHILNFCKDTFCILEDVFCGKSPVNAINISKCWGSIFKVLVENDKFVLVVHPQTLRSFIAPGRKEEFNDYYPIIAKQFGFADSRDDIMAAFMLAKFGELWLAIKKNRTDIFEQFTERQIQLIKCNKKLDFYKRGIVYKPIKRVAKRKKKV